MKRFAEIIIKHRTAVIICTLFVTILSGVFIKDLKINADILSYLPESDPVAKNFNYIGRAYGGNSLAIVVIETENIFNSNTIKKIQSLTSKFKNIQDVTYVTSLTSVLDIKKTDDSIEIGRLIDEYNLPETQDELEKLKNYTLSRDMYRGKLVSEDAKSTLIMCRLSSDADKIDLARKIKKITLDENPGGKVYFGGLPFQMSEISDIIVNDLIFLVPLIFLLICVSLFISFRSLVGVLLPVISVSISIIWTLGIMGLLKVQLTAISDIIPIILVAVGSAYSIHVISKFEECDMSGNVAEQSKLSLMEVGKPVILAALTTMAGFISFVFGSYLGMIREFGIFSSIGVFFSLIVSITFVPAVLSHMHSRRQLINNGNAKVTVKHGFMLMMDKFSNSVITNNKIILVIGLVLFMIAISAIPYVERKVDMLDYFKPDSSIRLTEELMQKKFGGTLPLQILVKGDIQNPEVLIKMKQIGDYMESLGNVYNSHSVADLIEEMNDVIGNGKSIPDSRNKVSNLWFLIEGEEIMTQLVNADKNEAIIQSTISNIKTDQIRSLITNVESFIKKIENNDVSFVLTGIPSVYQQLDDSIMRSQMLSLVIAIVLVFICLLFFLRSFIGALIGLVPIIFSIVFIFGFMGIFNIPLDIATVLVGGVAIGIGIDYSIHFLSRFKIEFEKNPSSVSKAMELTMETTGKAILTNVITVTLGFLILYLADLVPLQRFGMLIAITMISAGLGAITLMPAIIIITRSGVMGNWTRKTNITGNQIKDKR